MDIESLVVSQNPWWSDPRARVSTGFASRREAQGVVSSQVQRLEDRRAIALVGPRQVGKTVVLLQTLDELLDLGWPPGNLTYFDFSDPRLTEEILPNRVVDVKPPTADPDQPRVLLFDEISRAVNWDLWLKNVVDRGGFRVAVTDSASSLLRAGTRESGQGRWDQVRIEGLSFVEALSFLAETADHPERAYAANPDYLDRYLRIGGFPEHLLRGMASLDERLEVARRLREDIVESAVYRDFARFEIASHSVKNLFIYVVETSGSIFSAAQRAEELGRDYRTVQRWIDLLEDAGLVSVLPRYAKRPSRRLKGSESPKLSAADHGLVSVLSAHDASVPSVKGRIFEAVVFRHLRGLARNRLARLSYFRFKNDVEIDFVLEVAGRTVAVEVTGSVEVSAKKLAKLESAAKQLGADQAYLVHGGISEGRRDGIVSLPLAGFLLRPERLLEEEP
jgi:predicted AAA+ superfamily ATPase